MTRKFIPVEEASDRWHHPPARFCRSQHRRLHVVSERIDLLRRHASLNWRRRMSNYNALYFAIFCRHRQIIAEPF
jgi:hypothetical protein